MSYITIGRFGAPHGIKGWLRINSGAEPAQGIFNYQPWYIETENGYQAITLTEHRQQGSRLVAHIEGCDDRDTAQSFTNKDIVISREQLPDLDDDQFYWADLEGLSVINCAGDELGVIDHLFNTGASDVMVVQGNDKERLIPFVKPDIIKKVDLGKRIVIADWDVEF